MNSDFAWMDKAQNCYTMEQLSDRYLRNILGFLCRGGGYHHFLDEEKIMQLFKEAEDRRLDHSYSLDYAIQLYQEKQLYLEAVYLESICR